MSFEAPRRLARAMLGTGNANEDKDGDEGTEDEDKAEDEPATFAADGRAVAVAAWAGQKAARGRRSVKDLLKVNGWTLHRRGKHLVYKRRRGDCHRGARGAGSSQTLVMAATPSDHRAARNTMAQMNRLNDDDSGGVGSSGGKGGSGSGGGGGGGDKGGSGNGGGGGGGDRGGSRSGGGGGSGDKGGSGSGSGGGDGGGGSGGGATNHPGKKGKRTRGKRK
jgi:hypothetical protein